MEITEAALVKDILYVFQGTDGKIIQMSNTENCYQVEGKATLNTSLRDIIPDWLSWDSHTIKSENAQARGV